eukprot:CAMPEP_0172547224 /NCGR_PEP_ID=MMETSP1067-20121228/16811_1 /TAXON_ID=265564 ORGANISM="Thalassiosira punctigera, Strain Tpunct2005C2" /NCGR_SAMPLE_ID=MMETSP1067 /ASSEMBLY_ACC=CAM_ASM_000444 /LENGTH=127 /DNA_ID=CAMNT_0013334277 /DNA_START=1 /DNA_END=381 /DNA_ORIENTATION=-
MSIGKKGLPFGGLKSNGVPLPTQQLKTGTGMSKTFPFAKKSTGSKDALGADAPKFPMKGQAESPVGEDGPKTAASQLPPPLKSPLESDATGSLEETKSPSKDASSSATPFTKSPQKGAGFIGMKSPI